MPAAKWPLALALSSVLLPAELRLATSPMEAGGTGPAVIYLLSQGRSVAGVQFDLEYDPALTIHMERGKAAAGAAKDLYVTEIEPGKKRVLVVGLNRESMPDDAAVVLSIRVPVRASGAYELKVARPVAVDPDGEPVAVPEFIADVHVRTSRRVR